MKPHVLAAAALGLAMGAQANDSALNDGRYGPEPIGGGFKEESVIEMAREDLLFEIGKEKTHVEAAFVFISHKKGADAVQLVGFPDEAAAEAEARRRHANKEEVQGPETATNGPIENLITLVNGERRQAELKYGFVQFNWDEEDGRPSSFIWTPASPKEGILMAWYAVQVKFPPTEEVNVVRKFDVANGSNVTGAVFFEYSTHTGAAWKGPIGELTATVKLKDGLTVKDLAWRDEKLPNKDQAEYGPWTIPQQKDWEIVSPTELKLHWKNFEPRTDKTRRFIMISLKAPPYENQ